jgi:periplasmic protein CpxP/Spy
MNIMNEIKKYRLLWTAIGLLLVLNIGILAWFTFFAPNMPRPQRLFLEKELKFDPKQAETYRELRNEHAQKVNQLKEQVKGLKEEYFKDLAQTNISDETLKSKAENIESKMVEADVLTFKHFQKVRQMCTPTQQERFDEVIADLLRSLDRPRDGGPPPHRPGGFPKDGMPPPPEQ